MSWTVLIQGIYILASVFAVGVVAIESMGLLGGADDHGGDDAGDAAGHDGGDMADVGHGDGDADGGDSHAGETYSDTTDDASGQSGVVTRGDEAKRPINPERYILRALGVLRLVVYFALGFGPMGLVAMLLGSGLFFSIVLAVPVGVIACLLYRSLIRFQASDLDSTVHDRDLIGHQAKVLFAIYPDEIGRVRVTLAQMVCDRYAVSDSNDFIPKGARVNVVATGDKGLVVAMPVAS